MFPFCQPNLAGTRPFPNLAHSIVHIESIVMEGVSAQNGAHSTLLFLLFYMSQYTLQVFDPPNCMICTHTNLNTQRQSILSPVWQTARSDVI